MSATSIQIQGGEHTAATTAGSWKPLFWGAVVGLIQAASPLAFWWLAPGVVWAMALFIIAAVYIGFAVADGRPAIVATEVIVASGFIILASVALTYSSWLVVIGLVAHGIKDLVQHRTHFVANTRWWPPFCLVVDFVAALVIAVLLLTDVHLHG